MSIAAAPLTIMQRVRLGSSPQFPAARVDTRSDARTRTAYSSQNANETCVTAWSHGVILRSGRAPSRSFSFQRVSVT
eukprot:2780303-Prymnesium_polylepis.1